MAAGHHGRIRAALTGEERFAIYVWRAQRHGGDTKTGKSRRTLALPRRCVDALREHHKLQAEDRLRAGGSGRTTDWSSLRRSARR